MMSALTYALSGMSAARDQLTVRANNIANWSTPGYVPDVIDQTAGPAGPRVTTYPQSAQQLPQNILSTESFDGLSQFDFGVSLERELVGTIVAEHAYKASATLTRTAGEMEDALLDVLA